MAFRRRWCVVMCVLGLTLPALAAAAGLPAGVSAAAFDTDPSGVRKLVLSGAPADLVARSAYGNLVVNELAKELGSTNAGVQLNAAMLFGQLASAQTLSVDTTLEGMLKNPNEAVRYWGAKGLAGMMPLEVSVGPGGNRAPAAVINALATAAAAPENDKSVPVKREIVRALGQAGDVKALIDALNRLATALPASSLADRATLDVVAQAMGGETGGTSATALATLGRRNADAVAVAVVWAKLLRGQLAAADDEAGKAGTSVPTGQVAGVNGVIEAAAKVISAGKGTAIDLKPLSSRSSPGVQETLDRIDDLVKKAGS